MNIPPVLAQILRYYHVEKWPVGTIARHRGAGLGQGWPAQDRAARRSSPICVYPSDAGDVPDTDRQPAVRDGTRTRLP
jgi:hypothetical protein